MGRAFITGEEKALIDYVSQLIAQGEEFLNGEQYRGKSRAFNEWRNKIHSQIERTYGRNNSLWSGAMSVMCFPGWYDRHFTGEIDSETFLSAQLAESDRKTAINVFRNGVGEYISILKTIIEDVKVNGLPDKSTYGESRHSSFSPQYHTNISPQFSQQQSQNQSQEQSVKLEALISESLKTVEENYGAKEAEEAKKLLDELGTSPNKWGTVQKVASFFINLGRDAFISVLPVLTQVLLKK